MNLHGTRHAATGYSASCCTHPQCHRGCQSGPMLTLLRCAHLQTFRASLWLDVLSRLPSARHPRELCHLRKDILGQCANPYAWSSRPFPSQQCCRFHHLAAFLSDHIPVVAATACLVPFLLHHAASLGRHPPWRMKLQCLALVTAFPLGMSCAVYVCMYDYCVHPPAPVRISVAELSPSGSVVRQLVVAPDAVEVLFCPGATA